MSPLRAIDTHVHLWTEEALATMGDRASAMARYFGADLRPVSVDELAERYRSQDMMAVLLAIDDETTSGLPPISNDSLAAAVRAHPDVFVGFAGIDPWKGRLAIAEARRAAQDLGLRGLKFNPGRQGFFPNDARFYPLWEEAQRLGLICLFHTGMMGAGAGTPGGGGYKLKYTQPIPYLDDVAADFPQLTIIAAHPSWPWQDEGLAVARHKANVYLDLSGWAPKHFPEQLVRYAGGPLQDKCLFGSDWPVLSPERWLEEFAELPIKPEARRKILLDNARRILGIDAS